MPLPSLVEAGFDPAPSIERYNHAQLTVGTTIPADAAVVGILVTGDGPVPSVLGLDRETMAGVGFTGRPRQSLVLPRAEGPTLIAVGIGDPATLTAAILRDSAATFARAAQRFEHLVLDLTGSESLPASVAGLAAVEGITLARYRYDQLKHEPVSPPLRSGTLVTTADRVADTEAGGRRGLVTAEITALARDLENTPPAHLTATRLADVSVRLAAATGLEVEVYDRQAIIAMGLGGVLGVNAGSGEEPRVIKLTYRPDASLGAPAGHLALVGKGIMYDAGGISLKPSDAMHAAMKLDMSGAATILAAMTALHDLGCRTQVTGYLMCTDNMPSGTALRLGDVLTIRGGRTVEVVNADAEGRLVLSDGIVLSTELGVDAIVTIATLTGAAMRTFGTERAALLGTNDDLLDQVERAADATDEKVWQLPMERAYRPLLDSAIADIKNLGGENAGTITAALFLDEFTAGIPFAHIDICGPMMATKDEAWRTVGATGFGARLLAQLAIDFTRPVE
ncbi:MAG: leucyl aminopeptidase [Chloroflexi bacterium]|nr:leucyl aminopeptidase [Chloroflexota bacterium]